MGKYTIQEHWPVTLKVAANKVTRAKLERKSWKAFLSACENLPELLFCLNQYMEIDSAVKRAKAQFAKLYQVYQQMGGGD